MIRECKFFFTARNQPCFPFQFVFQLLGFPAAIAGKKANIMFVNLIGFNKEFEYFKISTPINSRKDPFTSFQATSKRMKEMDSIGLYRSAKIKRHFKWW